MNVTLRTFLVTAGTSALAIAGGGGTSGGGGGVRNPTPANAAEVRIFSVLAPAGSAFQFRASLTEPRPIWSTGSDAGSFGLNGFALWGPGGDAAGVAFVKNGHVFVNAMSPGGNLGNGLDYPFLILNLNIPGTMKTGDKTVLDLAGANLNTVAGPLSVTTKPGTLTVGGSVSISGVYPGGGVVGLGKSIKIRGTGFSTGTRLTGTVRVSSLRVNSPDEMEITLAEQTTMDMQSFTAVNLDGSSATFFSYLKGKMEQAPTRALLQTAEPGFQLQTHALATITIPALGTGQFVGLALQNPNPGPVVVTLTGGGQSSMIVLKSGDRVMDELGALLNGATLNPGDTVSLVSTTALQILGVRGDDVARTVAPFLPVF